MTDSSKTTDPTRTGFVGIDPASPDGDREVRAWFRANDDGSVTLERVLTATLPATDRPESNHES